MKRIICLEDFGKGEFIESVHHSLRIRFLGAAGTVTGSKYLITWNQKKILVDCGLFQGLKELRLKNWDQFPIDPKTIDAVILSHAHIDHSGYIPKLIQQGFKGKVFCTKATRDLCQILLPDTGYLQEEEAEWLNRKRFSKHQPALPLFTRDEAVEAIEHFHCVDFDHPIEVVKGLQISFRYAGHILGASSVILECQNLKIAFSGDVGRQNDPIMYPPAHLPDVDYLIVESTYGNRKHPDVDPEEALGRIVNDTAERNGVVLIPAFTVGRAQTLMHFLAELKSKNRIPKIPIYLNSPMATNVTSLFQEFRKLHRLSDRKCDEMCDVVRYVKTPEESKALNLRKGPMIIISASGMATGGRILHHLKAFAANPDNAIVLSGFQAAGTRGRSIQDGAPDIKIHRQMVPIRASVHVLENVSAHADFSEIGEWLEQSKILPRKVFVTHGELNAAQAMSQYLSASFGWICEVPKQDQEFELL